MAVVIGRGSFKGFESQRSQCHTETGGSGDLDLPVDTRISNNLQKISHHILQLKKMADSIGTSMDSKEHRRNIRSVQDETNILTKETNEAIRTYQNSAETPDSESGKYELKVKARRFRETFHDLLKDYKELQTRIKVKMRDSLRSSLMKSGFHDIEVSEDREIMKDGQQLQLEQMQTEVDLELIKQREHDLKQLEQDIRDITSMFKDLAVIVEDQGEVIDIAENNMEIAAANVEEGVVELKKAESIVVTSRKKKLMIVMIVLVVVVVVVVVICLATLT